jgi:S-adenosyl methyltransferase
MTAEHAAFNTGVAHQARIADYLLGGKDNFAADRKAADAMIEAYSTMVELMRANRAFLGGAPGLVQIQQWRPAVEPHETFSVWAGVARKQLRATAALRHRWGPAAGRARGSAQARSSAAARPAAAHSRQAFRLRRSSCS